MLLKRIHNKKILLTISKKIAIVILIFYKGRKGAN